MKNLWQHIAHWLVSDLYTLEERALFAEEARRLKLKTDIQEARINAQKKRNEDFRIVATWRYPHQRDDVPVYSIYELSRSKSQRKISGVAVTRIADGGVIDRADLNSFITSRSEWTAVIKAWLDGVIDTPSLPKLSKNIILAGKPK